METTIHVSKSLSRQRLILLVCIAISSICLSSHAEIYRYKDENGKWVYSDKKPKQKVKTETIEVKTQKAKLDKPKFFWQTNDQGKQVYSVTNPFYAPLEIEIQSESIPDKIINKMIEPASTLQLLITDKRYNDIKFNWVIGDPKAKSDDFAYEFPSTDEKKFLISQGFNGSFSHFSQPNTYAVDVGMTVGTTLSAARAGTVLWVKDDYHMGGVNEYFFDKANFVMVLHNDGTYAVYAHILQGSAEVSPGDKVEAGDTLALSGSTGFSTGPHLHFAILRNAGLEMESIPFKFIDTDRSRYTPTAGTYVVPEDAIVSHMQYQRVYEDLAANELRKQQELERKRKLAEERRERAAMCQEKLAYYDQFDAKNNVLAYMVDENGRELTQREQNQALAEYKQELKYLGCWPKDRDE